MEYLIEGYRLFHRDYFQRNRDLFCQLARRQTPKTMVISCCDSRVDPGLIFSAPPGEIFTLRNVANLVPPFSPDDRCHGTSAAIEFAVCSLNVEQIIVLGHARCGGVRALLKSYEGDFIGPWMRIAEPARIAALTIADNNDSEALRRACEQESIKISLVNLRDFPWVREREREGRLKIYGGYFDIEGGDLQIFDEDADQFKSVM